MVNARGVCAAVDLSRVMIMIMTASSAATRSRVREPSCSRAKFLGDKADHRYKGTATYECVVVFVNHRP